MTADDFRQLALSLDDAIEGAHMGHPDFRANGRIFATLHTGDKTGMVKLLPEEQREFLRTHRVMFEPSPGAWGRQGCTTVILAAADKSTLRAAMNLAWQHVMDMAPPKKRGTPRPPKLAPKPPRSATAKTAVRKATARKAAPGKDAPQTAAAKTAAARKASVGRTAARRAAARQRGG